MSEFCRNNPVLLGLIGYPLGHTVSPAMHEEAGRSLGLCVKYYPLEIPPSGLESELKRIREEGFLGCNITIPYKKKILESVTKISGEVEFLGAANTIIFRDDEIIAENTDWKGFLRSWDYLNLGEIIGKHAVILGAGGAAESIVFALVKSGVKKLSIFCRKHDAGQQLLKKYIKRYPGLSGEFFMLGDEASLFKSLETADIFINTTPVGMYPDINKKPVKITKNINPGIIYYDLIYNPQKTDLAKELEKIGIKTAGGLEMLVEQAALSFELWTGLSPDRSVMRKAAVSELSRF